MNLSEAMEYAAEVALRFAERLRHTLGRDRASKLELMRIRAKLGNKDGRVVIARLLAEVNRLTARLEREQGTVAVPMELLEECLEDMRDLRGEHDWHKDEPRCGHAAEYARLSERIAKIEALLDARRAAGEGRGRKD